jgi:hydroxypyruvate isomerase
MYQLAVNIELLFSEAGPDPADRVRAAAAAGFDAVEMFGTFDKDVHRLAKVLSDNGMTVCSVVAEPYSTFTFPGTDLRPFFDGLDRGVENARVLGSPRIAVTSGVGFPAVNRTENLKRLIDAMAQAVERTAGSGVKLVIEAVNTRIDHPGALLDRTEDAIAVARGVNSESLAIMYDLYHSIVNGEDPATELANAHGLVDYVGIADAPGRGEPGSGTIDWPGFLSVLRGSGYAGPIGLEVFPTGPSAEALRYIRSLAADA